MYRVDAEHSGAGAFAKVFKGVRLSDNKPVVVKKVNRSARKEQSLNECLICTHLMYHDLRNVVKILDIVSNPSQYRFEIVMERLNGGELFTRIIEAKRFSEKDAARVMRDILIGINQLHRCNVIHSDLKPENIVFVDRSQDSELRIIDFGLSILLLQANSNVSTGVELKDVAGTPGYLAPEIIKGRIYSARSDMWAAGVILYSLLSGSLPFNIEDPRCNDFICLGRYFPLDSAFWRHVSPEAKDLVRHLLEVDPNKRFTCEQALAHGWIAEYTTSASDVDFGEEYVKRISHLTSKQRFRKVVNGIIWSNRVRKLALTSLIHAQEVSAEVATAEATHAKLSGILPMRSSKISPMPISADDIKAILESTNLRTLKAIFVQKVLRGKSSVDIDGVKFEDQTGVFEQSLNEGIDYDAFCEVFTEAGIGILANAYIFDLFDSDKNGKIDYRELLVALASFQEFSQSSMRLFFDLFDIDSNGTLSFNELQYLLGSILAQRAEKSIPEDFGTSTVKVMHGQSLDVLSMYNQMDSNNDGHVSYEEFSSWMAQNMDVLMRFFGLGK